MHAALALEYEITTPAPETQDRLACRQQCCETTKKAAKRRECVDTDNNKHDKNSEEHGGDAN